MYSMIKSEHLKQKHSFQNILVWLAPTITMLLSFLLMGPMYVQNGSYNWWYVLILPGSLTIMSSFIIAKDSKNRFHGLFSVVIDKKKIWYSKIILCTIYLVISCLLFFIEATLIGYITEPTISVKACLVGTIFLLILFSWQIPLWMYMSMKTNSGLTIAISMACNILFTVVCSLKSTWWIPFATPARVMCYIVGILPNGLPVEDGSYPINTTIILIGAVIAIVLYITISYLTAKWFEEQEV